MTCVLSSEHESQIVATIGTFLGDNLVGCKEGSLACFSQSVSRTS